MAEVKKLEDPKDAVIEKLADIIECRDNTAVGHIVRISKAMKLFIDALQKNGLYSDETSSWDVEQMVRASQLHDIGKIEVDDLILRKPGKLTDTEFEVIKRHTLLGGEIISEIQEKTEDSIFLEYAKTFAVYHHEKWDGTGYPHATAGEEIPLPARLMAIIDVYDALVSERPYKKPFTHEEALKIVQDAKGSSFDPQLTDVFLSVADSLKQ